MDKEKKYPVLGIDIAPFSKEIFFRKIESHLQENNANQKPMFVVTVNPEIIIQSIFDNEFKNILQNSSINTADGIGISWAINYLYGKKIERITGSDSLEKICSICAKHNKTVFLYGALPAVANKAAQKLTISITGLHITGTYSPDSRDMPVEDMPPKQREQIKKASVVFVALGAPAQEKWIYNNLPKLPNCKLIVGIGGSFDFISGDIKRAPKILRRSGLEWAYRLYNEPSRWRRMLKLPLFVMNIIMLKLSGESAHKLSKMG